MALPPLDRSTGARAWRRDREAFRKARETRDRKICLYHAQGYPVEPDIAEAFDLSKGMVHSIIRAGSPTT